MLPIVRLFGAWLTPSRKNQLLTSLCGVTQDVISPVNGSLTRCPATRDLEKESLFIGVLVISTALAVLSHHAGAGYVWSSSSLTEVIAERFWKRAEAVRAKPSVLSLCFLCSDIQLQFIL